MVECARKKAARDKVIIDLLRMDVQNMGFEDNTFDTVTDSFVFGNPIQGLQEVRRVVKSSGKVVLLERVLSANRIIAG